MLGIGGLAARLRYLEERLARYEPDATLRIWDLLTGVQRILSPEEIQSEVRRLQAICAEKGVGAVLTEVCTCRELLESLADACHESGLTSAGQYLTDLATPW